MLTRLIARLKNWLDDMDDVHVLRGLDDRMLKDMGIARGDIARRVPRASADDPRGSKLAGLKGGNLAGPS